MKKFLLLTPCLVFLFSCTSQEQDEIKHAENGAIIIDADFSDPEIKYSDFVDEISFIPLLAPSNELIEIPNNIFFGAEKFGFLDSSQHVIWVFNLNGEFKYSTKLKLGRGPGEGVQFDGATFGNNGMLHVFAARKVLTFDKTGNLIQEIQKPVFSPINEYIPTLNAFISYTNNGDLIRASHNLLFFNQEGVITDSLLPINENRRRVYSNAFIHFYTHQNTTHHISSFNNYIYAINNSKNLVPKYQLELNEFQVSEELFNKRKDYPNALEFMQKEIFGTKKAVLLTTVETDLYLNFRYTISDESGHILYNKSNGEVTSSKKLVNDFYPNMRLFLLMAHENYVYGYTSGLGLIDYFKENKNVLIDENLKNYLQEIIDNISDPGIPFLVKAKIKEK